jgi:hypothetical protein
MKIFIGIPLLIVLSACDSHLTKTDPTSGADITHDSSVARGDRSKYHVANDVTIVVNEIRDTLKYTKAAFNGIVDMHPEFFNKIPEDPDITYFALTDYGSFGSEAGRDEYYILYGHFLKQKNGIERYDICRSKLIDIYSNINSLFAKLQYGGTYFGHQRNRIIGYAEYSVYVYKYFDTGHEKTYNISKQKELYIASLRQLVADEISIDMLTSVSGRTERSRELNAIVDNIDKAITNVFYLRRAQEFHYRHYEYH